MDIVQLRYFVTVAKSGHLTNAAKRLNVAQSALSVSIGRLEREVGVPLFDRVGRNIYLNKCGEIYLEYAEQALDTLQRAQREVDVYCGKNDRILNVGIIGKPLSGKALAGFMKQYPNYKICMRKIRLENVEEELKKGNVDYVVSNSGHPNSLPGLVGEVIWKERMMLAVPADHPLAGREWISLKEAKGELFIDRPKLHEQRTDTDEMCMDSGFEANVTIECFPCEIPELIAAGTGVALVTESWASGNASDERLVFLPIRDPSYMKNYYITWLAGHRFNKMAKGFRRFLEDYFEQQGSSECGECSWE